MHRIVLTATYLILTSFALLGQSLQVVLGPVEGHSTDTSATLWLLVSDSLVEVPSHQTIRNFDRLDEYLYEYAVARGLDAIYYNVKKINFVNHYGTLKIYLSKDEIKEEQRTGLSSMAKSESNFSFLLGSCAFPFPYKGIKGDNRYKIFSSMMQEKSDFMVWMGDNVYYLDNEWESYEDMFMKNVSMRLKPEIGEFLKSCPQYAIWDDHDFGPNNSDGSFENKKQSLAVFKDFWPNSSFGSEKANGVFHHFSYEDADFFMLDTRYNKVDGETMFGDQQMEWLKKKLLASRANFKFIVTGSQMLADRKKGENLGNIPEEKEELLFYIRKKNISGVVFLNGDRHYTELNYFYRGGDYSLHEFTCSPLTSIANPTPNLKNPLRIKKTLVRKRNYGKITISGQGVERKCKLEVFDSEGNMEWSYSIDLADLE